MADTCTNCNAILSPTSSSCPSCGSPRRSPSSSGTSGGGFCGSCGTVLASKFSPCPKCGHVKTTFAPPPQSGGFCGGCGGPLASKFSPCPKCGHVKTTFAPPPQYSNPGVNPQGGYPQGGYPQGGYPQGGLYKNEGTGLILSIVLGIFGLCGIGQIYAGRVGRGIGIMIGVWILVAIGIATMGIGLIAVLAVFIWQIFDTKKLCKKYNDFLASNGSPPW